MHETAHAHLHFDVPGPDRPLRAGGDCLRGWLVAKPGSHYADLRVRHGIDFYPAIFGLPRTDLAQFFKSPQPALLAEFEIRVKLEAGFRRLYLEGLVIDGRWDVIETIETDVVAADTPPPPRSLMPVRPYEAAEGMRALLRFMRLRKLPVQEAVDAFMKGVPIPHTPRHPHLPFHGHVDEPWCFSRTVFGRLTVIGCVFHETRAIRRIFATTDLLVLQDLNFGRASALYASHYPNFPQARACGFDGIIDIPSHLPRPFSLRLYAELDDGSWHLTSVVRSTDSDHEYVKIPFPPYAWQTYRFLWERFDRACLGHELAMIYNAQLWKKLFGLWREYRREAPRLHAMPPPVRPHPPVTGLRRVHLVTHNLNREGAPLFLLELARHLRSEGCELSVTSGLEGPLRQEFTALDAAVDVVDLAPLYAATSAWSLRRAIRRLRPGPGLRTADLVIANTLSAYWGIHLARRARRPSLYYIHESTTPTAFFHGHLAPAVVPVAEESFRLASKVSFLTPRTRHYYETLSDGSNYCLSPGWIDLAAIDADRRLHSRAAARAALGVAPGRQLVVNIGSVCDRKGQHVFLRAIDWMWRRSPQLAEIADFRMVGGRDTAYDRDLQRFLASLGLRNVSIVPETAEVYRYYSAADVFVCSSYEESFPRVVLEAMAFEVPIVASHVHGIPEIVRRDREAALPMPGDPYALSEAIQRMLAAPDLARKLAESARARVAAEFDSRILLPRHAALARAVATGRDLAGPAVIAPEISTAKKSSASA